MNLEEKLRGVLEYYFGLPDKDWFYKACGMPKVKYRNHCSINQATQEILSLFASELPKEMVLKEGKEYLFYKAKGYNQCLSDIKKKWGIDD